MFTSCVYIPWNVFEKPFVLKYMVIFIQQKSKKNFILVKLIFNFFLYFSSYFFNNQFLIYVNRRLAAIVHTDKGDVVFIKDHFLIFEEITSQTKCKLLAPLPKLCRIHYTTSNAHTTSWSGITNVTISPNIVAQKLD